MIDGYQNKQIGNRDFSRKRGGNRLISKGSPVKKKKFYFPGKGAIEAVSLAEAVKLSKKIIK